MLTLDESNVTLTARSERKHGGQPSVDDIHGGDPELRDLDRSLRFWTLFAIQLLTSYFRVDQWHF